MECTLLSFLLFLHGKCPNVKSPNWSPQNNVAKTLEIDPTQYNKVLKRNTEISDAICNAIASNAEEIIGECLLCGPKNVQAQRAVSFCKNFLLVFSLPEEIKSELNKIAKMPTDSSEEEDRLKGVCIKYFSKLFKRLAVGEPFPENPPPSEPGSVPKDCVNGMLENIKNFGSGIYLELSERDEEIEISVDKGSVKRRIYTKEIFVNPKHEKFSYVLQRATTEYTADQEEYFRRMYEDLQITLNDKDILEYAKEFSEKSLSYAEQFAAYDVADLRSAFSFGKRKEPGVILTKTVTKLEIPIDPELDEVVIEIGYTSNEPLETDRSAYSFRVRYPCKRIWHTYKISPEKQWQLVILPFEPFYAVGAKNSPSKVSQNSSIATVEMNYWTLPGTGYVRRYFYHKVSRADSYAPGFFDNP
jgi:hypothetical protein